ncbi:hypothetical protein TanjilG_28374 [Lupinus angustifolius]|uniref:Cupin type-1 domain-containing protein n=1 Tax=Lupinus angustifolius TaxID=3871 RepID=A0A4P1RIP9_LUPAN|nr:PREDICTED: sucrose-binding protein-like isoform X2 [Lupinus angustifolius]OIW11283.1 hypothetical protein TanjilG_28374 [Lupinus angustifolius]
MKFITINLSLPIFLFILVATSCLGTPDEEAELDPELTTCIHQCKHQDKYSRDDKQECTRGCHKYHQMKKQRERQIEEQVRRRKEHEMEQVKEKQRHQGEEEEEEEEEENPFLFDDDDFETRFETEDGRVRVLHRFTKKSNLLRGIHNFRLATLEAEGHTFVSPCHFDSEAVFFVVKGRATIGMVREEKTERFNLEQGDIIRVPSGTPVYLVNRDHNQKLFIAKLHMPLAVPGKFEAFYGPGGRNPESFLTAFSWELLEAALKSPREKLERLFQKQEKGGIFKISKEDVESVSKVKGSGIWPFGGRSSGPFNIFKSPIMSNQYGRLFETNLDDHSQLKDLNLILSFANITNGSMTAPMYATRATNVIMVSDGKGYIEMVCPHVSSTHSYHPFKASLKPGVVFVVPTGHPFIIVASNKNNLQLLRFQLHAQGDNTLTFAGKKNVVKALDKEAKELAFNYPADKVDEIFSRDEDLFLPGPDSYDFEEHARAYA